MDRVCSQCGRAIPAALVYKTRTYQNWCRPCRAVYSAKWREKHQSKLQDYRFQKLYGITLNDYNAMLVAQDGVCAICHQPETALANNGKAVKPLAVDHDHNTGAVRSLLCNRCNVGIGHLDRPELLQAALEYLT